MQQRRLMIFKAQGLWFVVERPSGVVHARMQSLKYAVRVADSLIRHEGGTWT